MYTHTDGERGDPYVIPYAPQAVKQGQRVKTLLTDVRKRKIKDTEKRENEKKKQERSKIICKKHKMWNYA